MSEIAVGLDNVGKMYRLYGRPVDKVLDALGADRLLFWRRRRYRSFWALRGVDLEVARGERLGIIGPNGAGKTTLLKIVTGNAAATEGRVTVRGRIQALMDLGTGFHPEFTGRQNIRASLAYQGYARRAARAKEREIVEFAELDEFIDQPVRTYSAGMYARLSFATATAIEPEVLILDEVLGAGDAYFAGKCLQRMRRLTEESGATVIFVSHDTYSVERLCGRCVWLDRGKIVMQGATLEVTKAYGRHVRVHEERRRKARNRRAAAGGGGRLEPYSDVILRFASASAEDFALQQVALRSGGESVGELALGEPQDSDPSHLSWVVLDGSSCWSDPVRLGDGSWARRLARTADARLQGLVAFSLLSGGEPAGHSVELSYLPGRRDEVAVSAYDHAQGQYVPVTSLPPEASGGVHRQAIELPVGAVAGETDPQERKIVRWPGSNELMIRALRLVDGEGRERTIFRAGERMVLRMDLEATQDGQFPVRFCAVLYRMDGVRVSCHLSDEVLLSLRATERRRVELDFGPLNLGNGDYVISPALYKYIDPELHHEPQVYDLHDREYEFRVFGRPATDVSVFHHPAAWRLIE